MCVRCTLIKIRLETYAPYSYKCAISLFHKNTVLVIFILHMLICISYFSNSTNNNGAVRFFNLIYLYSFLKNRQAYHTSENSV